MKKWSVLMLTLLLCFSIAFDSHATESGSNNSEHPETTEYPGDPSLAPDIVSQAAIVMDAKTGQILYEKNSDVGKYPASITKVITVLIALEHNLDMNQVVTMSENAIWGIERSSTNIGLDVGEQVTIRDLLYATMVNSANECAYELAELIAGDAASFAKLMNKKAEELGCKHTHFVTPNGLHDDDHYTTAYDMALIMKAALENDKFREIAGTVSYTIPPTNLTDEARPLWTGTKMINPANPYYYEYCEGGKNGYTTNANNTLVTFAKKDGLELICVVLDCDGLKYTFTDSKALYEYCYNNYMYFYPLSDFSFTKDQADEMEHNYILDNYYNSINHNLVNLTVDKNYCMLIKKSTDTTKIERQINLYEKAKDNILGEIDFLYNGEQIGNTPITNGTPSLSSIITTENEQAIQNNDNSKGHNIILILLIIFVGIILGLFLFVLLLRAIRERQRNERRNRYTNNHRNKRRRHRRRKYKDNDFYI